MIRAFVRKLREDNVSAFAAQAAFFVILSALPFFIFVMTLLKFLPLGAERLLLAADTLFPPALHAFAGAVLSEAVQKTSGALLSISAITALWSASRGCLVVIRGMNEVYGNRETRNYIKLRLLAIGYTLALAVVMIVTLLFLVFGNRIFLYVQNRFPEMESAAVLVISIRTVVSFLLLGAFFWLLYLVLPNRKAHATVELPGALLCAAGWSGFSFLYSFYIDHMSNFSAMYGSLTAIVLCMIWLYACMYILFIGAEVNVVASDKDVRTAWRAFTHHLVKTSRKAE